MNINEIDYDIRKLNSVILRVVIIGVLFCVYYYNTNYFSGTTYLISSIIYVILLILNMVSLICMCISLYYLNLVIKEIEKYLK